MYSEQHQFIIKTFFFYKRCLGYSCRIYIYFISCMLGRFSSCWKTEFLNTLSLSKSSSFMTIFICCIWDYADCSVLLVSGQDHHYMQMFLINSYGLCFCMVLSGFSPYQHKMGVWQSSHLLGSEGQKGHNFFFLQLKHSSKHKAVLTTSII